MPTEKAADGVAADVVADGGDDGAQQEGDAMTVREDPRVQEQPGICGQHPDPAEGEYRHREVRQRRTPRNSG